MVHVLYFENINGSIKICVRASYMINDQYNQYTLTSKNIENVIHVLNCSSKYYVLSLVMVKFHYSLCVCGKLPVARRHPKFNQINFSEFYPRDFRFYLFYMLSLVTGVIELGWKGNWSFHTQVISYPSF